MMAMRCGLVLFFLLAGQTSFSQRLDASRYTDLFDAEPKSLRAFTVKPGLGKSVLVFYKRFVSSQDGSRCQFTPTCSEYAVQAAQRNGLALGTLAAFDRLSRCHGFSRHRYAHSRDERLIDPVE